MLIKVITVSLLRKTKKKYDTKLNEKDIADNKQFWRTVKPLLSEKPNQEKKLFGGRL